MLRVYASVLCNPQDLVPLRKFAKAVTNKVGSTDKIPRNMSNFVQWLLYLLSEDDSEVVVLAARILARLLVIHGSSYSKKFTDRNGGYITMEHAFKRWWNIPALWPICFSIFFGQDVGLMDLERPFDQSGLLNLFFPNGEVKVQFPDMLSTIVEMVKSGLRSITQENDPIEEGQESLQSRADRQENPKMSSTTLIGKHVPRL